MDVKAIHNLITHWYLMSPKLSAARITDEPRGRGPSSSAEARLDLKLTIEEALERLAAPDGITLTPEQHATLIAECDRKFPVRQVIMGATACPALGRRKGESTLERFDAQRNDAALSMAIGIARLHVQAVKAVMTQTARVGAPVGEEDLWPFLRWELGTATWDEAARIYWDAITRLFHIIKGIEIDAEVAEKRMVLHKLIERLNATNDPDLQISEPTVRRYVERGILHRTQVLNAGSNGGPAVFVYDLEDTVRRLKATARLRGSGESLDAIAAILNGTHLTIG